MTDDDAWRLPIGATLDEARGRLILARFGPEAKQIGEALAARLRAQHPDAPIDARVFGLDTLLASYPHPRATQDYRIALGMIAFTTSSGSLGAVAIVLDWETGQVLASG